jgi:hypothetical protein
MRARYYDPVGARFLSRDSHWPDLATPQNLDPYQYVAQQPLSFIDPAGTDGLGLDAGDQSSENNGGSFGLDQAISGQRNEGEIASAREEEAQLRYRLKRPASEIDEAAKSTPVPPGSAPRPPTESLPFIRFVWVCSGNGSGWTDNGERTITTDEARTITERRYRVNYGNIDELTPFVGDGNGSRKFSLGMNRNVGANYPESFSVTPGYNFPMTKAPKAASLISGAMVGSSETTSWDEYYNSSKPLYDGIHQIYDQKTGQSRDETPEDYDPKNR